MNISGDALAYLAALDNRVEDELEALDLSHSIPDYGNVYSISGNLNLSNPSVEILNKWISDSDNMNEKDNLMELVEEYN